MPKPITVRLIDGLGDQLFGYYAGAALAPHWADSRLETSRTRQRITDHDIEILNFESLGDWISDHSVRGKASAPGTIPERPVAKAFRDIPTLGGQLLNDLPGQLHPQRLRPYRMF